MGFSVKELFLEIRADVRELRTSMAQKSNHSEVEGLRSRLEAIEQQGSHNAREAMTEVKDLRSKFDNMGWKVAGALTAAAASAAFTVIWSLVKR